MKINQKQYIQKLLEKFNMNDCREYSTPMVTKSNPIKTQARRKLNTSTLSRSNWYNAISEWGYQT